jgi:hypothetical protein
MGGPFLARRGIIPVAHDCGLYSIEDMRPVNESRMRARWKLGRALAEVERRQGKRNDPTSSTRLTNFGSFLEKLGLTRQTAVDVQRLGTMPDDELAKACADARKAERLLHYNELIVRARPWWYKENRKARHRAIRAGAVGNARTSRSVPADLFEQRRWHHARPSVSKRSTNAQIPRQNHFNATFDGGAFWPRYAE